MLIAQHITGGPITVIPIKRVETRGFVNGFIRNAPSCKTFDNGIDKLQNRICFILKNAMKLSISVQDIYRWGNPNFRFRQVILLSRTRFIPITNRSWEDETTKLNINPRKIMLK